MQLGYLSKMAKSKIEIATNILFWLLTSWLITSSLSIESKEIDIVNGVESVQINRNVNIIINLLVTIGLSCILFYSNLQNILRLNSREKLYKVVVIALLLFCLSIALNYTINYFTLPYTRILMPSGLIWGITLFYFTASITYGISKVWLHTEKQKQQLSLEKTEAELNLLRAQLHPHFLFNVLNNLLAMIDQKASPELAHSLNKLSGLLRYVVNDTAQDKVPINKEIKFIKDFAELQSLGYEEGEIKFDLSINGPYGLQLIEPGIFVPFIENAFKYGVEPEKESTIKVTFDVANERKIRFKITNPIHLNMQHMESSNTGIRSTQERLQLVYPDRHSLTIDQDELFSVQLEITTDESDHSR